MNHDAGGRQFEYGRPDHVNHNRQATYVFELLAFCASNQIRYNISYNITGCFLAQKLTEKEFTEGNEEARIGRDSAPDGAFVVFVRRVFDCLPFSGGQSGLRDASARRFPRGTPRADRRGYAVL